jgi:hypothetical protein
MQCARHPEIETELACGRCEAAICPKCVVMTDVGARCPTCAPTRKLPQFEVGPIWVLRGAAAALIAGVALGTAWRILLAGTLGFFSLLIAFAIGHAIAEAVSLATNRKAGPPLQIAAACGVAVAYVTRNLLLDIPAVPTDYLFGYVAVVVGIIVASNRLRI